MRYLYLIFIAGFFFTGCTASREKVSPDVQFAAMYNPSEYSLNVDYQFYHLTDDMTSLYIRLFPGELLFNQANDENEYRALVQIDYSIFELDEDGAIAAKIDSSLFVIKLGKKDQESSAYFTAKVLSIESGKKFLISLMARDMQRGTLGLKHMFIEKEDVYSAQNFSIVSARTGYPRFQNYISPGDVFRISYRIRGEDTIFVDFYKDDADIPRPPMTQNSPSAFPYLVDTTIILAYSDSVVFALPEQGLYHFRFDTTRAGGIAVNNFGSDFPQVKSEQALYDPLFYLATLTEYRKIGQEANLKRAVDDFWLKRTNSIDRSRELIRIYYNRVLYSNLFFTSDREGWKTDRGMLFILFGPPNRMKDSGAEQRWYYISKRQGKVIEFVFERKPSAYSNNDLIWKKNAESMQYWSSAVSSWRSGKVYSLGK